MSLHPELQYADPEPLPEDTELARKLFEEVNDEHQRVRDEWWAAKERLARTDRKVAEHGERSELVEHLTNESALVEERLDEVRRAYYALQHRDTEARNAESLAESRRAFDDRQAANAALGEERKNRLHAKFGRRGRS